MFTVSALRVEHTGLTKQLQGAFVAQHGDGKHFQKFIDSLEIQSDEEGSTEERYARDRARLKADSRSKS